MVGIDWVALTGGVLLLGISVVYGVFGSDSAIADSIEEGLDDAKDGIQTGETNAYQNTGRDEDIDAFVANIGGNQLLTNQGGAQGGNEGTFVASVLGGGAGSLTTSFDVALGDVDGDGDLDALIANEGTNQLQTNQGGDEEGTEGEFVASDLDGGKNLSRDIALADLDGDGDLDAFIANNGTNQILVNQGGLQNGTQGEFLASDLLLGAVDSTAVALGDIDGDGDIDALVANTPGENQLLVNQGDGEFSSFVLQGGEHNSLDIALGDLDGDGDLDALVANFLGNVQLLTNDGGVQEGVEGEFVASDIGATAGDSSTAIALGDLDGDGDLDAILANFDFANGTGATAQLLINQGNGEFLVSDIDGVVGTFFDIALGDVDDDGDIDALFANLEGSNLLLVNQGGAELGTQGEFVATELDGGSNVTTAIALGDIDGDGTEPAVDQYGFPNINPDGLLPDEPAPDVVV